MTKQTWNYGDRHVMRKATLKDSDFVLNLRNQDYVKKVSWNNVAIRKENHEQFWKNNYEHYWIIETEYDKVRVGFVRVINNEVSIAVLKEYWNQSYGYFALQELKEIYPELKAEVKMGNNHSLSFFIKCGFVPEGFILGVRNKSFDNGFTLF